MKTQNPVLDEQKKVLKRVELVLQNPVFYSFDGSEKSVGEVPRDLYENFLRSGDVPQSRMAMNRSGLYTDFI